ncbi:MAG: chemotaxis protein MotB [Rhodobacteraceae bacterium HLUCCO18]|nr:MAG: chemotaxis protein MotB [Rhodobacteraceae bacterium HLUCCO18]
MSTETNTRPLIIKRKKVSGGDGHHGGAWKVAYADFVTAMMAFFMMMWLLNATTEQQRKGIADYFSPTIPITRISGGGDGSFGGESVFSETTAAQNGTGATSLRPTEGRQAMGAQGTDHRAEREEMTLRSIEDALMSGLGDASLSDLMDRHVQIRLTDEGLLIEVFAREGTPLFDPATGGPEPVLQEIARIMAILFATVENHVAVAAHVAAEPVVVAQTRVWDRSLDHAQAMRVLLVGGGLDAARLMRVTGHADRSPVDRDAISVRNNRIVVTLLREF